MRRLNNPSGLRAVGKQCVDAGNSMLEDIPEVQRLMLRQSGFLLAGFADLCERLDLVLERLGVEFEYTGKKKAQN